MKRTAFVVVLLISISLSSYANVMKHMRIEQVAGGNFVVLNSNESVLVVETDIEGLKFSTTNRGVIKVNEKKAGLYYVHLYPGTHIITISAKGFKSESKRIYIPKKEHRKFNVLANNSAVESGNGNLKIISDPPGATIKFNGMNLSDKTPQTFSDQPAGTHVVTLIREGFLPLDTVVTVKKDETSTFNIRLAKALSGIEVNSDPSGATVIFNGREIGLTPLIRNDLDPGEGMVLIQLEGYQVESQFVRLTTGKTANVSAYLSKLVGKIEVTSSQVGAKIYLENNFVGAFEQTPVLIDKIEPGEYRVSAKAEGYKEQTKVVQVSVGLTERISFDLQAIPGSIYVTSTPPGAAIYLDDQNTHKVSPDMLNSISVGSHTITLKKDRFAEDSKVVAISPGKTETVIFTLKESKDAPRAAKVAQKKFSWSDRGPLSLSSAKTAEKARPWKAKSFRTNKKVKSESFIGRVVVLHFWASWSPPSKASIPFIKKMYDKYRTHGLVIIGAAGERKKTLKAAKSYVSSQRITFPVVYAEKKMLQSYNIATIPCTVIIDKQGKIRQSLVGWGAQSEKDLEYAIKTLLKE